MNQEQRKYLIGQVENTYRDQTEKIEKRRPSEPSLNNYLVASFLDNTIQFQDLGELKKRIRQRVLKMGSEETLVKYEAIIASIENELAALEQTKKTIIMKIQIGSNQVLDRLIAQVDNMADLNIMQTQLLIKYEKNE